MFDPARSLDLIKGALLEPEKTWNSYLPEANDWQKTAILLTAPLIVVSAVVAYVLGSLFSGASALGLQPTLGSMLMGIVLGAISAALVALIVSFLAQAFGGKGGFARGLAATTLAFVPGYVGQALSSLPWIGWLLAIGLGIYGLVLLWRIIPSYLEVPAGRRVAHYVVTLLTAIVVMVILGAMFGGGAAMHHGGGVTGSYAPGPSSGVFGDLARQGELMAVAEEDRYEPPGDGRLEEDQIEEFLRVMQRTQEAVAARQERLAALSERTQSDEQMSIGDLSAMMGGISDAAGLNTAEIEVVKSAGGNWAEHQWVKQTLRTAWLQKDIDDAVKHNYALYQQYGDELDGFIAK